MKQPHRPRSSQSGFTMVELMVSLVLFTVAIAGVLAVSVTISTAFRQQRAITQAETSARSPMDFLSDVLRNSSPGVPSGAIADYAAATTATACTTPQAINVINSSSGPDALDVIYASGAVVTASTNVWSGASNVLDVESTAGFSAGDFVVVTNTSVGMVIPISSVASATQLNLASPTCNNFPTGGFAVGSIVIRAMHAKFTIDPTSVDGIPNLMIQVDPNAATPNTPQPVADGVEDMQVALGIDANNDGQITEVGLAAGDDEWLYNVALDPLITGNIRAVRVTLVARAVNTNLGTTSATYLLPKAEDRPAATIADVYRRRTLQSTIEIRNLQGSP